MKDRDIPESMENSPDFVKVMFDEKGNPLGIKPFNGAPTIPGNNGEKLKDTPQRTIVHKPVEQDVIVNWISNLGHYANALREDFRVIAVFNQKRFNELEKIIAEKSYDKNTSVFIEKFETIENEISNLKNQYNLVLENLQLASKEIKNFSKKLETMEMPYNEIFNQLNTLDLSVSNQINTLKEKLEGMKVPEGLIFDQLNSIDLRMSTVVKEISNTKTHELETDAKLKSLVEEMQNNKSSNSEIVERLIFIEDELKKSRNEIFSANSNIGNIASSMNQKMDEVSGLKNEIGEKIDALSLNQENSFTRLNAIEEKVNGFSRIGEELESLKIQTSGSIDKLTENQEKLKADLLIDQEKIANVVNDRFLEIQKMLKKPKKRIIKPTRAKVTRFLKKNFKIKPFSKVLVVTDKRNTTFANTLYEATRKVSKKSLFVVEENRTIKMSLDKPVIEAIKKSNYAFIVGKYSLKKMKEIAMPLKSKIKIVSIKRTLNYSLLQ